MRWGFPLRPNYRLELWRARSGWFDQYISEYAWDAVARNDPLANDFVLIRSAGTRVARYGSPDDLERALEIPFYVKLTPKGSGNFYFLCRLEVTTLNDTDLEELTHWLKGDVSPAVAGRGEAGGALRRGRRRRGAASGGRGSEAALARRSRGGAARGGALPGLPGSRGRPPPRGRQLPRRSRAAAGSQRRERGQHLAAVEQADVLRLDGGEAAHPPPEVHQMGFHRRPHRFPPASPRPQIP